MKYLFILLAIGSCMSKNVAVDFDKEALSQKWMKSNEECKDDLLVFRPESYDFPPSRGRASMELRTNGTMSDNIIAPACGFLELKAKWKVESPNFVVIDYDKNEYRTDTKYEVLEASKSILRLKEVR